MHIKRTQDAEFWLVIAISLKVLQTLILVIVIVAAASLLYPLARNIASWILPEDIRKIDGAMQLLTYGGLLLILRPVYRGVDRYFSKMLDTHFMWKMHEVVQPPSGKINRRSERI